MVGHSHHIINSILVSHFPTGTTNQNCLTGTTSIQSNNGVSTFSNLAIRAEAGSHFTLMFTHVAKTVTSSEINVKPHHMFITVHPSDGQYGAGSTKADIGAGITVRARDGANNLLTGADNTNAGTDYVTVTALETAGTVVDANLLGTKQLFLSGGEKNFADLGLQGDAGQHFKLRFSYNSLTVESSEFNVKPLLN